MGFPKSRLVVEGEPLLHRQLRLLSKAGASELLVSVNPACPESLPEGLKAQPVPDRILDSGPLAGVEALLQASQNPWVLIIAVDLPRLTVRFIEDLVHRVTPAAGVVPIRRGQLEPLCAVYPRGASAVATHFLERGRLAVTDLASTGLQNGWLRPWTIPESDEDLLTNWNHPEDLWRAGRT